ncbi:SRPBCC domain-containing protein [uncultured Croceitalea sp.]|uniref:SRPBCC family protein n=1 Tax=uncultured Croceitalea sp. TaxID=1798908 RepID=UPI003305E537
METFAIYHDLTINAAVDRVFDAIAQPEHLVNWWPLKCSGEPKLGATYNFNFTDAYDWYGEVSSVALNEHLHIKMTQSDANWNDTSFGFDLAPHNTTVKLKFWHKGWPACNDEYRQSSFCWAILLQGLKNYVEKGAIVPFEERE